MSAAKRHVTFGAARGAELKDPTGMLQSTGRSPIGKATFPISEDVREIIVRRWIREALAPPPQVIRRRRLIAVETR